LFVARHIGFILATERALEVVVEIFGRLGDGQKMLLTQFNFEMCGFGGVVLGLGGVEFCECDSGLEGVSNLPGNVQKNVFLGACDKKGGLTFRSSCLPRSF
jgi:hypothetical protein